MKKEKWLAILQVLFIASLVILPACSSNNDGCNDCDCSFEQCAEFLELPIVGELLQLLLEEITCPDGICEVEMRFNLPDNYCGLITEVRLSDRTTGQVYYADSAPGNHTMVNGVAVRNLRLRSCFDSKNAKDIENLTMSFGGSGCRTDGCSSPTGKPMVINFSPNLMGVPRIEDCKIIWEVNMTQNDFSSIPGVPCIDCCK